MVMRDKGSVNHIDYRRRLLHVFQQSNYFHCTRINCKLEHIMKWLVLFVDMDNRERMITRKIVRLTGPNVA